jgi:uncharacterized protein
MNDTVPTPEEPPRFDAKLLELLVCPLTKRPLDYDPVRQELLSRAARLAYPIRNGIAVLLPDEARALDDNDDARLKRR